MFYVLRFMRLGLFQLFLSFQKKLNSFCNNFLCVQFLSALPPDKPKKPKFQYFSMIFFVGSVSCFLMIIYDVKTVITINYKFNL